MPSATFPCPPPSHLFSTSTSWVTLPYHHPLPPLVLWSFAVQVPPFPTLYQTWSSRSMELLLHWLSSFWKLLPLSHGDFFSWHHVSHSSQRRLLPTLFTALSRASDHELAHSHSANRCGVYPIHLRHPLHEFQISNHLPTHSAARWVSSPPSLRPLVTLISSTLDCSHS